MPRPSVLTKGSTIVLRIRIHDLRHTYATLALEQGIPVKVVSENLGHADISTTLRTYAHVIPAQRSELAARMDAALFGDDKDNTDGRDGPEHP
ncbi:MAG: tyrosine-type recombinase/integrase [Chloroflexota bacterium]|nr:tyrosine-type recombinase/integrase [Chloroflexota bacterium]